MSPASAVLYENGWKGCIRTMRSQNVHAHNAISWGNLHNAIQCGSPHGAIPPNPHHAISRGNPHNTTRKMVSAGWNPHDAIPWCNLTMQSRRYNPHNPIPWCNSTIRTYDPTMNPHGVIRTMRSHATNNTIRTMQRAIPRSPSHNAIPQCHFTKQILMMQSHTTICSMRFYGNPHGEIAQPDIEVSASTKNKEKSHFSKLRKVVRTTETRVCTTETGISTDSDQSLWTILIHKSFERRSPKHNVKPLMHPKPCNPHHIMEACQHNRQRIGALSNNVV